MSDSVDVVLPHIRTEAFIQTHLLPHSSLQVRVHRVGHVEWEDVVLELCPKSGQLALGHQEVVAGVFVRYEEYLVLDRW